MSRGFDLDPFLASMRVHPVERPVRAPAVEITAPRWPIGGLLLVLAIAIATTSVWCARARASHHADVARDCPRP